MDMPIVEFDTTYGNIVIELNAEKAPITVANFIDYVESGHYDGLIFHRVIDGFMIQGGGMDSEMNEKRTGTPIKNEADNGLKTPQAPLPWLALLIHIRRQHSFSSMFVTTIF